jgi:sugar phosphate isomerase/epimerase
MWSIGVPGDLPPAPMTALALVAKARELKVKVVQFGPNLPLPGLPPDELDRVLSEARTAGIEIEVGARGLDADYLAAQIEFTARIGARLLRCVPDYTRQAAPRSAADLCRVLEPVLPLLHRHGTALALENSTIPSATLAEALDSLASPLLGITLDTVNSLAIPEGTAEVVRALARHTLCLHVKDFSVDRVWHMMGFTVEGRPAGQGQLNIPWLLETLRAHGRSPNAILELWPPRQKTLEETIALEQSWAVQSIDYLRRLIPD